MQSKLKVIAIMLAAAGLASHAAQAQEKVVIGYISDLSGLYADLEGKGGQVAIQMAIEGDVELSTDAEMERNAAHESASHESPATAYSHAGDFESVHTLSLPEVLTLTVDQALSALAHLKKVWDKLQILHDLGLVNQVIHPLDFTLSIMNTCPIKVFMLKASLNEINEVNLIHNHPLSANDTTSFSPTTKWSRSAISTTSKALLIRSVIALSARLGSATPEGWLWLMINAAAL